ncbi:S-layer homology domain-containing protein [Paenibacillus sp. PsM32]|uniref:S-layer homology domain-containing protein n=1 Tax=unclassified Paenibacillus TaxID=185978 RepID=UPI0023651429|nr:MULTISPECIES: S-layer homology domain-containing protein [unclassified Paenibacillus]MDN4618425.1 S-layer homology domain-containing protein [Paenibacillus sp. PsM32]WDF52940.1 S-layer homology domain-containing protein [Paenibacillus sp. KACC 21273]
MKKLSIFLLALMLILSQPSFAKASSTELKEHWAAALMEDWISKGILKGYEDGKVHPDRSVTRAEFLSLLHKGFDNRNIYDTSNLKNQFKDVSSKNWYYQDVLQAVHEGFIKGYPNNTFQPNKTLTRQEAAVILANKLNLKEDKLDLLKEYTDSNTVATWASTSFAGVLNHAVLTGYPNKTLMPKNQLTRAEAVTLLDKAITYQSSTVNPKPIVDETTTGSPSSAFTNFGGGGSKTTSKVITTVDLQLDSDKDGLPDYMEELLGTDKNNPDSDGDGLTDGQEVNRIGTSPLKADTNGNGMKDGLEDNDHDGLNNIREMQLNTDPNNEDSDFDGWNDGLEIQRETDPLKADTDNDGLDDSIEENFGMNPLNSDTNGNGIKDGDETVLYKTEIASYESDPYVTPSVKISSKAKQADTTVITNVYGEDAFINKNIPGYIGAPYEFTTDVKFDTAEMTFEYDPSLQSSDFEPTIFYYNKEKQLLEKVPNQTYNPATHSVTAIVKHFSTYILLNGQKWDKAWEEKMKVPETTNGNLDIVFSIDTSGSMVDNDPDNLRLKAVSNFVDKLGSNDRASIYQFDDYPVRRIALSSNKQSVQQAVYSVHGAGGTDIYYALSHAVREIKNNSKPENTKIIVLLTDGQGNSNNNRIDSVLEEAKELNIIIYTIGLGVQADKDNLTHIAYGSGTGGEYFFASSADVIDLAYENVAKETIDLALDTDQDGLPDYFEINGVRLGNGEWIHGLDPKNADTDGDGLFDGEELKWLLDDQNTDLIYFTMKSDPTKYDTDGDSLHDRMDAEPLIYNLTDRNATLMADLSYVNLESSQGKNMEELRNNIDIDNRFNMSSYDSTSLINPNPYLELAGWKIIKAQHHDQDNSGFAAVALKRGNTIAFAFRGTEMKESNDLVADAVLFVSNSNMMTYYTEGFVASVLKENPNAKVYSIGHSLGGFLSSVISYDLISLNTSRSDGNQQAYKVFKENNFTFVKGKNFNPAPLFISAHLISIVMNGALKNVPYLQNAIPLEEATKPQYQDQIDNYWIEGEFLSLVTYFGGGVRIGKVYPAFTPKSGNAIIQPTIDIVTGIMTGAEEVFSRHGINNFYEQFPKIN